MERCVICGDKISTTDYIVNYGLCDNCYDELNHLELNNI